MSHQTGKQSSSRSYYLDNLRIYLTILVIFHHTAIAYGGSGDWPVKDPAVDPLSPIFLTFFNALNQTYFMSVFFLLAGYFTPRSLERKGAGQFLKDRLIRLGVPVLVYTTLIVNINVFVLDVIMRGLPYSPFIGYTPGHLWFLQALLIFAVIYVAYITLASQITSKKLFQFYPQRFPPNSVLILSIAVLAALTFLVRLAFPIGVWAAGIQPAHFAHYVFAFFAGILAYRGKWFERLPGAQARRWGIVAVITAPLFFPLAILGGVLENTDNLSLFLGGPTWQAFATAVWESVLFISISIYLLNFFRERLNRAGPLAQSMAQNVYTVYIIHQTLLISLNVALLDMNIPTILKFLIVSPICVFLCFLLSYLIRKLPYTRRVLG